MRRWLAVLAVFSCGALLRLPAFSRALLSDDEAIYAATAMAMRRGARLYEEVVDHKPPAIYHLYQWGEALAGGGHAQGAHVLVLLAVLLTGAILWRMASPPPGRPPAPSTPHPGDQRWLGALTAALFLVFSTTWHDYDALAANCELFLLVPQSAAALLLLRALERKPASDWRSGWRWRWRDLVDHLGIGLLIGLSALCKYQGVTFLGVSAGMLAWAALGARLTVGQAVVALGAQIVGCLVPAAAYLVWAARNDSVDATVFWFTFNFSYVGAGLEGIAALRRGLWRLALIGGVALVPYALGVGAAVATIRACGQTVAQRTENFRRLSRTGQAGPEATAHSLPRVGSPPVSPLQCLGTFWLLTSAVAVATGGRFFGHYFHLVLPALCLLAAPTFLGYWRRGPGSRTGLLLLCALPALAFFLLATWARPLAEATDDRPPPYQAVVERITALSDVDDPLFVWGNSPQLYVLARRPLGSRFTFCNYMTGESPGTPTETGLWDPERSSLPAAWDMLFADLDARRPALFVDAAAAGWDGYEKYPIARYPRLAAYVATHYRRAETVAGVEIYRRR